MRLNELNSMLATVRQRKTKAEADAKRHAKREGELVKEIAEEKKAVEAALKEAS